MEIERTKSHNEIFKEALEQEDMITTHTIDRPSPLYCSSSNSPATTNRIGISHYLFWKYRFVSFYNDFEFFKIIEDKMFKMDERSDQHCNKLGIKINGYLLTPNENPIGHIRCKNIFSDSCDGK